MCSLIRSKRQVASLQNSAILGSQCVLGQTRGCCSILFLVFEVSMTQGFSGFLLFWVVAVAVELAVGQALVLGSEMSFSVCKSL